MTHVLLINPNPDYLREPATNEPLNLLTLAAPLVKHPDIKVSIIDGAIKKITKTSLTNIIKKKHITHLACTSTTPQYPKALKILNWSQQINQTLKLNLHTILGGVHATILQASALKDGWDTVCTLEGDLKIVPIIKQNLRGLIIGDRLTSQQLNKQPFPVRHLTNPLKYHPRGQKPRITIVDIRGCPFNCIFCDKTIMGYKPRCRSPKKVIQEIKYVIKKWGIRNVIFYADTFTINHVRVRQICQLLTPLNIKWECNSRVDTINQDLLTIMAKAGCTCIRYGLESANQRVLKSIRKGITVDQVKKAVAITQAVGIDAGIYAIYGFPEDDWQSAQDLVDFLYQVSPNRFQLSLALPLPNTELYRQVIEDLGHTPPKKLEDYYYAGKHGPHTWVKRTKHLNEAKFKQRSRWLQQQIAAWAVKTKANQSKTTNIIIK